MEGAGKVVGEGTTVVFLRHWHEAGEPDEEQQEELKGKSRTEHSEQEGAAGPSWPILRKGGIGATFYGPAMWTVDRGSRLGETTFASWRSLSVWGTSS